MERLKDSSTRKSEDAHHRRVEGALSWRFRDIMIPTSQRPSTASLCRPILEVQPQFANAGGWGGYMQNVPSYNLWLGVEKRQVFSSFVSTDCCALCFFSRSIPLVAEDTLQICRRAFGCLTGSGSKIAARLAFLRFSPASFQRSISIGEVKADDTKMVSYYPLSPPTQLILTSWRLRNSLQPLQKPFSRPAKTEVAPAAIPGAPASV